MTWRIAAISLALLLPLSAVEAGERTLVFAAASMKDVVETLSRSFNEKTGNEIAVSFASSGTLARQIEAGAPADIYIAANPDWMGYLAERDLIDSGSRENIMGNTLVAVAPEYAGHDPETIETEAVLNADRIAMGDPGHVPAGIYARQALTDLGLWSTLQPKVVFGENVRVSMALAARGEVDYAIVYGSDAAMREDIAIIYTFPADTHEPIAYAAALTPAAGANAKAFFEFLFSEAAQEVFESFGFKRLSDGNPDN